MLDVAVIGAGISGLAAAFRLKSAGLAVRVFEAGAAVGGNLRTTAVGPYLLERGPHSFLGSSSSIWRLLADASLVDSVRPATPEARFRFVYRDGSLHALPLGPIAFLRSGLLSSRAKARLLAEPFLRGHASPQDTVQSFFTRRFGPEAAQYLAGPFVSGIYAGDPARLGAYDSFPRIWQLEADSGSVVRGGIKLAFTSKRSANGLPKRRGLFSFPGGLGEMARLVASRLTPDLDLSSAARELHTEGVLWRVATARETVTAKAVVVAVPPHEAARLLPPGPAGLLQQIHLAPVAVVHLGSARCGDQIPRGFGCLIPRHYGVRTLGTVFVSQLFAGRAPEGGYLLTSFIGGALDPEAITLADEALITTAVADLQKTAGVAISPEFTHVLRHERAIPQFEVGYRARIAEIGRMVDETPGLFLAGNYLSGVGMNDAVESGFGAAERAMSHLRGQVRDARA